MSTHAATQPAASAALGFWPLDRPFPVLLTAHDLRLVFGSSAGPMSQATYEKRRREFRRFEVESIGGVRYSGAKVRAFVLGEAHTHARTFGAKRGPRAVR